MEQPSRHPLLHVHPVDSVQPEAVTQPEAQYWHNPMIVQQIAEGLPPLEEAGAVRGPAKALRLTRCRQLLYIQQAVERRDFSLVKCIFYHQIALHIEEILQQMKIAHFSYSDLD